MDPSPSARLSALRDIHLPDSVSIWPPAPGWWILGGLLLLLAGAAALLLHARRRRQRSWATAAAAELARIEASFSAQRDAVALATALSSLLRRTSLARFPEERVAGLHGDAWFELLCRDVSGAAAEGPPARSASVVRALTRTAYAGRDAARVHPDDCDDCDDWIAFVRSWIRDAA
jgi:hypothetical protein